MSAPIDPRELLTFIESGMSMCAEDIAARWPEWSKMKDDAQSRWERESRDFRLRWGGQARGTADPMVDSRQAAMFHWVYLPLIRLALAPVEAENVDA